MDNHKCISSGGNLYTKQEYKVLIKKYIELNVRENLGIEFKDFVSLNPYERDAIIEQLNEMF